MPRPEPDPYFGDPMFAECDFMPGDFLMTRRIGVVGDEDTRISIEVESEGQWIEDARFMTSVLLTPITARQLAVTLIELADQCDGGFATFMPPGQLFLIERKPDAD